MSKKAYFYAVFVILIWSSTPEVTKLILASMDSFQLLFHSTIIAAATLFFIALLQGKAGIIREYKLKDYFTFTYMGFLGAFLYCFFFYTALALIGAQEARVMN